MNGKQKAKWIVGVTGTAFTAFVLSQFAMGDTNASNTTNNSNNNVQSEITAKMSEEEKELVQLDWSNFSTSNTISYSDSTTQTSASDRQTKRS